MSPEQPQINPSVLLENRDYLRNLARSLVFDEHRADDLVQQACLALLERPPNRAGSVRSWMTRVVQNLAYSMLARESERSWRENLAASGGTSEFDGPEEERMFEEQQRLLDAVRRLRQPYRSAIFQRYYKDLSPTQIATKEQLSLATVKTRLRRGLELLRAELDASHSQQRGAWCLALLPMAAPLGALKLAGATGAAAYLKGILLMKKPIVSTISALALVGVASLTWVALDGRENNTPAVDGAPRGSLLSDESSGDQVLEDHLLPVDAAAPEALAVDRTGIAGAPASSIGAAQSAYRVSGRVVDDGGQPIAMADVRLYADRGLGFTLSTLGSSSGMGPGEGGLSTKTDDQGRFSLGLQDSGSMNLAVGADYYAPFRKEIMVAKEASLEVGDLKLDAGAVLAGRVVDSSGVGVAAATLESIGPKSGPQVLIFGDMRSQAGVAVTDAEGYFSIKRHAVGPWRLRASSLDHPSSEESGQTLRAGEREENIRISLADGYEISGHVVGLPNPMPDGLVVVANTLSGEVGGFLTVNGGVVGGQRSKLDANGKFRLRGLSEGAEYSLSLMLGERFFGAKRRSESLSASPGDRGVRLVYTTPSALLFQVVDADTGAPIEHFDLGSGGFALRSNAEGLVAFDTSRLHPEGRMRLEDFQRGSGLAGDDGSITIESVGYEDYVLGKVELTPGQEVNLGVIRMLPVPVVRVTVRDSVTRDPIAGALVSMAPAVEPAQQQGGARRMSFSVDIAGGDQSVAFSDGSENEGERGVTDENGVCVLTSMPGENVRIQVTGDDHAPYASQLMKLPTGADVDHLAPMDEGSTVQVLVVDAEGNPLSGMSVKHVAPDAGTAFDPVAMMAASQGGGSRTDSDGLLYFENLASGKHGFSLKEDPFASPFSFAGRLSTGPAGGGPGPSLDAPKLNSIDVQPGAELKLTLVASPRGFVSGVVREAGSTLAGARVKLLPERDAGPMGMLGLPGMGGSGGPVATTDSRGRYELESVPVGRYRLEITHPTRQMPSVLDASLREGGNELNVALTVAIIEGRITDPGGNPLPGLKVSVSESKEDSSGPGGMRMVAIMMDDNGSSMTITDGSEAREVNTDAEGYYQLRGVAIDRPLVVEASGSAYAAVKSEVLEVRAGETLDGVDLQLRAAGALELGVVHSDGQPASGYLIAASYRGEAIPAPEPKTGFVGPDGKGHLSGLLVGEWEISLRAMGGPGASLGDDLDPLPRTVMIKAGANEPLEFEVE